MSEVQSWKWHNNDLKPIPWHFYKTCEQYPHNIAQLFNPEKYNEHNGQFKWYELRDRVEIIASGFISLGVKPKSLVAIMAENSPRWTQVDLALCCMGAVSVTILPSLSLKQTMHILNETSCRYLIAGSEEILERIMKAYTEITSLEKIILLSDSASISDRRVVTFSDILAVGEKNKLSNYPDYLEMRNSVKLSDWFSVIYTSGSSGTPRGIVLTHFSISSKINGAFEFWHRYGMDITEKDRGLCYLPLAYIFDRAVCELLCVFTGATIAYADSPGTVIDDLRKYNPTWINSVSLLYEKIYVHFRHAMEQNFLKNKLYRYAIKISLAALEYRRDENGCYNMSQNFDLLSQLPLCLRIQYRFARRLLDKIKSLFGKDLRFAFLSASGISPSLVKFFYCLGIPICEGYGQAETTSACLLNPLTACKPGTVGINANGGYSRIAVDGELEVSGAGIFSHYFNREELTKESFTDDGWFKTGDIVQMDKSGYFTIVDRKRSIICTSIGKNIAPAKLKGEFQSSECIDQIFFVGDDKHYITALIVPDFNYFISLYEREGIRYNKSALKWDDSYGVSMCVQVGEDFISTYKLRQLIEDAVDEANKNLESFERIKQYTILPERFTPENGTMTPSQKLRKEVILQRYRELIEKMYE